MSTSWVSCTTNNQRMQWWEGLPKGEELILSVSRQLKDWQEKIGYFLFLSLGLTRVYSPGQRRTGGPGELVEPAGARACRRNILAVSGVVVVAELAGADPSALSVFGVEPSGDKGVVVVGAAAVASQLYWYIQRFWHLYEDGELEIGPIVTGDVRKLVKISGNRKQVLVRKWTDLISNCVAAGLTLLSWCFIALWIT